MSTPNQASDETIIPDQSPSSGAASSLSKRVGDYDLIEEIARGGMGVVYKANHRNLNRVSAVKMILGGRFSSEEELQRFRIEAESAAKLDHPAIVPIFEIGECEGQAFFAMKYIDGGSLAEKADGLVDDPQTSAKIMLKVAEAVHHAHQRAVLHRDLKPANILLDGDGQPFVTDLGLAKSTSGGSDLTHTGAVLGTPSYMPPEQAAGKSVTTAADVYSLGAILYQLLVGQRPYEGDTSVNVVMQVIDGPPPPPHKLNPTVDRDLELICMKAMQREPEDRYSSAQQMADDLKAWLVGDSISVKPPSVFAVIANWFKRNQKLTYAMFALMFGFLLCAPVALAFLSNDYAEVYEKFPGSEVPSLYRIRFPVWLTAISMILLFLVIWPSIGFCNSVITKPKTAFQALFSGLGLAAVLSLIFYCLLGWVVFLEGSNMESKSSVRALADAVWTPDESTEQEKINAVNEMFGGLDQIPLNERSSLVQKRLEADRFLSAFNSFGVCVLAISIFSIPIILGTFIGYALQSRSLPFWLFTVRYLLAWWALAVVSIATTLLIASRFNSHISVESDWWSIPIGFAMALAIAWLALRRWRKPKPAESVAV